MRQKNYIYEIKNYIHEIKKCIYGIKNFSIRNLSQLIDVIIKLQNKNSIKKCSKIKKWSD